MQYLRLKKKSNIYKKKRVSDLIIDPTIRHERESVSEIGYSSGGSLINCALNPPEGHVDKAAINIFLNACFFFIHFL